MKILDKRIKDIEIKLRRIVYGSVESFKRILVGRRFTGIERIGKLLVFDIDKKRKLLVHLKMTGQLVYCKGGKPIAGGHDDGHLPVCLPQKWTRAAITFSDRSTLYFNDMRTFGYLKLADNEDLAGIKKKYGVDPLTKDFNGAKLKELIKNRTASIKAALLNQSLIAGIGNIYADEALFAAGIRPDRSAGSLKKSEIEKLHKAIKKVLLKAISFRGTTFNNYVDADGNQGNYMRRLKVYGRAGKRCKRCKKDTINKTKVAQRGTHFCPTCQK